MTTLLARLDILRRTYLNHRFERASPLPPAPAGELERLYREAVLLPPRRLLMQPGAQTIDGLFFLVSLARNLDARTVFEIGTFTGVTTWTLGRNLPGAQVHTLDIPREQSPQLPLDVDDLHRGGPDALIYAQLGASNITQHWGDSASFDFAPWRASVDLVYVDGAHSADYVRSDTRNALQMVSPRGAIVWDDYWRLSPGVVEVLHDLNLEVKRVPGTRLAFHTPSSEGVEAEA